MEKTRTRGTLQEIARKAKVSPATVSRVVNQSASVSEELAARVRAAREKLGIDLRRSPRSRLIAFVLANRPLLHPFHSQVLTAAQAYCEARNYGTISSNSRIQRTSIRKSFTCHGSCNSAIPQPASFLSA